MAPRFGAGPPILERDVRRDVRGALARSASHQHNRQEIAEVIEDRAEGRSPAPKGKNTGLAPAQARNLLGHATQLFSWAAASGKYGLEVSPAQFVQGRSIYRKKRADP